MDNMFFLDYRILLIFFSAHIDKSKYLCFHKGNNHNNDDCIHLRDVIEGLVKKGRSTKYVTGEKRKGGIAQGKISHEDYLGKD